MFQQEDLNKLPLVSQIQPSELKVANEKDTGVYKLVDPAPKQEPSQAAVLRAVEVIKQAKRPLLLLGKGAAYAQVEKQLQILVDKTDIPFLPMSMAKGLFLTMISIQPPQLGHFL